MLAEVDPGGLGLGAAANRLNELEGGVGAGIIAELLLYCLRDPVEQELVGVGFVAFHLVEVDSYFC